MLLQPLPLPLPPPPLPLIDVDEILMLWLLAGAQPAQGRVEAGREGWRKACPRGHQRAGPGPYWLSSSLLPPVIPGEGGLKKVRQILICRPSFILGKPWWSCAQRTSASADASKSQVGRGADASVSQVGRGHSLARE